MFAPTSVWARARVIAKLFAPLGCWVSGSNRQRIVVDRALRALTVRWVFNFGAMPV